MRTIVSTGDLNVTATAHITELSSLRIFILCYSVDPSTVVLRVGSAWRKNGTEIPVAEVIPHPEWDTPRFDKDVAVIKTKKPIEFSDVVQPIALPSTGRAMEGGTDVVVSGWGKLMVSISSAFIYLKRCAPLVACTFLV